MATLHFVLPGDPATRTGGFIYDARIIEGLRDGGLEVAVHSLPDGFPAPTTAIREQAAVLFDDLPDGARVVIDGLALGVLPEELRPQAGRLDLIGLVHHPLAAESGLTPERQKALFESETAALKLVSQVITTSRHTAEALAPYGVPAERITPVTPGVDPAPLAAGSRDDTLALLCVANLVPRKGHDLLLGALAQLKHLDWRLTCAGSLAREPAWTERLRRLCGEAGLDDRVTFLGEIDDSELEDLYHGADLFVLASHYEGYGMVFPEAVAHGIPVLATRTGGIPEAAPAEASILVPPGDEAALTEALRRLLAEPATYAELRTAAQRAREGLRRWSDSAALFAEALGYGAGRMTR
ncbi:MAG: glycosyltransferase family 4 protein [Kiloniellales bacterium]|nr:glycosyltransferase family 4 protein [Kiloniellales bacterium]